MNTPEKYSNINPDCITQIIGFDLGHGETSLALLKLNELNAVPETITIFNKNSDITALSYHPTKGVLLGSKAILTSDATDTYIDFKKRPDDDPTYQKVMHDYVGTIHQYLLDQKIVENDENTLFIVGCPSDWCKHEEIVSKYTELLRSCGLKNVIVVSESRAAIMHGLETEKISKEVLKNNKVLVVDLGSSTTDLTVVANGNYESPEDSGLDLGASLIEKEILRHTVTNHPQKDEIEKIFTDHSVFRNRCEYQCRKIKEDYFNMPSNYENAGDYVPGGLERNLGGIRGLNFAPELDGVVMKEILSTPIVKIDGGYDSWPNVLQKLLQNTKNKNPDIGAILLTGGASKMDFVEPICSKVFPKTKIYIDVQPETTIAQGLARWGRIEIRTSKFLSDVDKFLQNELQGIIENRKSALVESMSDNLADGVVNSVIKTNLLKWKAEKEYTIALLESRMKSDSEIWLHSESATTMIKQAIVDWVKNICDDIEKGVTPICKANNIPAGIFNISSFSVDLENEILGSTELGSDPTILTQAVEEIISYVTIFIVSLIVALIGLSGVIGWIITIIVGLVAVVLGVSAADEKLKTSQIPVLVKSTLLTEKKVNQALEESSTKVKNALRENLTKDPVFMTTLENGIKGPLENEIEEKALEAGRWLIL